MELNIWGRLFVLLVVAPIGGTVGGLIMAVLGRLFCWPGFPCG